MTTNRLSTATLLCLCLLAGCDPEQGSSAASEPPPAALRGTWLDHWSTSLGYSLAVDAYDFRTGVWFRGLPDLWDLAPARGLGLSIAPDGSFLWVMSADGGLGGCQSYSVQVSKGTVTAADGFLHFHPTQQRQRYESTCDPSLSYDRAVPNVDFDLQYEIGATQDTGLPTLRLFDATEGFEIVFFLRSR